LQTKTLVKTGKTLWNVGIIALDAAAILTNGGRALSEDDDYFDDEFPQDNETLGAVGLIWDDIKQRWENIKELNKPDSY